ncbi:hypothetical protein C8R46DRAFT_390578 [Mycena filopes]|nr:hypothetical protein C8R46DRAFT_390578 [Mycena filopes]
MSADAQTATGDESSDKANIPAENSQDCLENDRDKFEDVPFEILCEIFRWTLPWNRRTPVIVDPNDDGFYDSERMVLTPPWRLGFVCKRWRECALGDPLLWSTIEIDCYRKTEDQITDCYPLAALETHLLRSGDAPLHVIFNSIRCFDIPRPLPVLVDILAVLVSQCHRWEDLHFEWESPSVTMLAVLVRITGRIPLLRRVTLGSAPLPWEIFALAPQLRKLFFLEPYSEYEYSPAITAPWGQLTHLRMRSPTARCIEILARAELLVECSLTHPTRANDADDNVVRQGTPIALLPHLRRFSVTQHHLLEVLSAPRLQYLFLGFRWGDDDSASVLPFLQRSQCQLLGLTLIRWFPADLPPLLRNIPTLRHFQADLDENDDGVDLDDLDPTYSSPAADVLFRALADTTICPRLESIHLEFWMPCAYEGAYEFIRARKNDTPLRFASLCAEGPPLSDARERLLTLATGDLEIVVADGDDSDTDHQPLGNVEKDMEPPCS